MASDSISRTPGQLASLGGGATVVASLAARIGYSWQVQQFVLGVEAD